MKLSELPYEPRKEDGVITLYIQYADCDPIVSDEKLNDCNITKPVVIEKGSLPSMQLYAIIANKN